MAAQIEISAFYRVLSIFSTFDGHAYVTRLSPLAEEPSCLCCHVLSRRSISYHGTVRILPSHLQGWLENPHTSRSAPGKWFVCSHLLWSPGECNCTQGGCHDSWPEQCQPLPWTPCIRSLFPSHIQATLACLSHKHLSQSLPYKFRQRRRRSYST